MTPERTYCFLLEVNAIDRVEQIYPVWRLPELGHDLGSHQRRFIDYVGGRAETLHRAAQTMHIRLGTTIQETLALEVIP